VLCESIHACQLRLSLYFNFQTMTTLRQKRHNSRDQSRVLQPPLRSYPGQAQTRNRPLKYSSPVTFQTSTTAVCLQALSTPTSPVIPTYCVRFSDMLCSYYPSPVSGQRARRPDSTVGAGLIPSPRLSGPLKFQSLGTRGASSFRCGGITAFRLVKPSLCVILHRTV
jgi:hypothetical protein